MRITTKGRYALRAITNLALADSNRPKAIKQIAGEEQISPEFLEQIFFKLKKQGIISSVRGPGGGFVLTREPGTVSVKEIFEAVGEGLDLTPCTTDPENADEACARMGECLVYDVWKEASKHINDYFGRLTLEKIVSDNKNRAFESLLAGQDFSI
ncbi:MAG TPA: Rrf2 family transcriptional regulator [Spirochaetia bacterium]|nr:Rrf2 family transcriptional regulator [Spirochaetia bacterium]